MLVCPYTYLRPVKTEEKKYISLIFTHFNIFGFTYLPKLTSVMFFPFFMNLPLTNFYSFFRFTLNLNLIYTWFHVQRFFLMGFMTKIGRLTCWESQIMWRRMWCQSSGTWSGRSSHVIPILIIGDKVKGRAMQNQTLKVQFKVIFKSDHSHFQLVILKNRKQISDIVPSEMLSVITVSSWTFRRPTKTRQPEHSLM